MNILNNVFQPTNIYLLEDDEIDAMSIIRAFDRYSIDNPMIRFVDGQDALDFFAATNQTSPFIILLDLEMPRVNGFEFLERIREDHALSQSVVFVLSTSTVKEQITELYRNNIAGYIVKSDLDPNYDNLIRLLTSYFEIVQLPPQTH